MSKPRIRVKGFEGDWKRKKLGELGFTVSGVGFPNVEQGGKTGMPFYKVSDMNSLGNEHQMLFANNYVTDLQIESNSWKPLTSLPAIIFAKVGAAALLNRKRLISSPCLFDNNMMAYCLSEYWQKSFAKSFFDSFDLRRLIQTGALPSINGKEIEKAVAFLPNSKKEQSTIGDLLYLFDILICKLRDKIIRLNSLKICYLTRLFPIGGGTEPPMRFKNFQEGWEIIRLKDVAEKVTEKNTLREITEVFTNSAVHGIISQRDYFDHDVAKRDNIQGYYIVSEDDFVYNPRISVTSPVGPINRNKTGKIGVISPLYLVFKVHGINKSYLEYYFKTNCWHEYMRFNGNTGARFDRFSISDDDFFNMPIPVPKSPLEQESLANYFNNVDNLINLHTQELERLKALKASFLDGMFVNP